MSEIKNKYGDEILVTIALENLPTSADFLTGVQSDEISSDDVVDFLLHGQLTVGTSPTADTEIRIYCTGVLRNASGSDALYPDTLNGAAGTVTFTTAAIRDAAVVLAARMEVDTTTSDQQYPFAPISVKSLFGGELPRKIVFAGTQNTAKNTNTSAAISFLALTPVLKEIV